MNSIFLQVSRNTEDLASQLKTKIKKEISDNGKNGLSMTTDIWTDNYRRVSYMSLTAHYMVEIGSKIVYRSRVIALTALDSAKKKTFDVLLDVINSKIDDLGLAALKNKITFVTDRGSNIVKALKSNFTRLNCSAHFIDNIVKKMCAVPQAKEIISEISSIVRYFKVNGLNEQLPIGKSVKSFSKTRWNSAYSMLKSVHDSWDLIDEILTKNKSKHSLYKISKSNVKYMIDFLEPFKLATDQLEGDDVNIQKVVPAFNEIQRKLESNSKDSSIVKKMKKEGITYYNKRNKLHPFHYLASVLYPPTNSMRIMTPEEAQYTKDLLQQKYDETCLSLNMANNDVIEELKPSASVLANALNQTTLNEIESYLQDNKEKIDENFDVLKWWNLNRKRYPVLYEIAIQIFTVPSSSAYSEREFSCAGSIVTDKRSRLDPGKVEDILMLKKKFNLIEQ